MIVVESAPGLATVQDLGWPVGRAMGLPRSGAMDPAALRLANALVGNQPGGAAIELALGGLTVRFDVPSTVAIAGGSVGGAVGARRVDRATAVPIEAGETVRVDPPTEGRFGYLAIRGGLGVPDVLGSRSTYLPTATGGFGGRRLQPGDAIPAGDQTDGPAPAAGYVAPVPPPGADPGPIRIVAGPEAGLFSAEAHRMLEDHPYRISARSDRMGSRLLGPPLAPLVPCALPSQGTVPGALQVPDGGEPIVILADGPTVGGYPRLAVLASADLGRFAQAGPGDLVRFRWIDLLDAQRALYRTQADWETRLALIRAARPGS